MTLGHDPTAVLDRWAPKGWRQRVTLKPSGTPYETPAAVTRWWGVDLDPYYEAKAAEHVQAGDLFWLVATRNTSNETGGGSARWIQGDARHCAMLAAVPVIGNAPSGTIWSLPARPTAIWKSTATTRRTCPICRSTPSLRRTGKPSTLRARCSSLTASQPSSSAITATAGVFIGISWPRRSRLSRRAGLKLYNEAVLITAVGSLPIRVGRQFENARKLGKTHQNVLVFCNGDPAKATAAIGPVEVAWPEDMTQTAAEVNPR